jgi:phosphoglycolate phosphatase-like HAD superfamily hydrolase
MTLQLCLFDLDDTLLRTSDLDAFRGGAHIGPQKPQYKTELRAAYDANPARPLYSQTDLASLRKQCPAMKWGVFTRSPRDYALTLLDHAYARLRWDVIIAFEDVMNTKPQGDGIWAAMKACAVTDASKVALVGENKADILSAYRGGCWAVLDRQSWPPKRVAENWWCLERVPDAIIDDAEDLFQFLLHPAHGLPELERAIGTNAALSDAQRPRFDRLNHFKPKSMGGGPQPTPIHVMGRLFSEYAELKPRASWHPLTQEVLALKDAQVFPGTWVNAIRAYVLNRHPQMRFGAEIVLTVIPFKPGRSPRLERLLAQVTQSSKAEPLAHGSITCIPDLLAYRAGAVSHSGAHLNQEQRFENVRDHLFVKHRDIVVLDDVVTSGASLIYAREYLLAARADSVSCVAIAKAIGNQ